MSINSISLFFLCALLVIMKSVNAQGNTIQYKEHIEFPASPAIQKNMQRKMHLLEKSKKVKVAMLLPYITFSPPTEQDLWSSNCIFTVSEDSKLRDIAEIFTKGNLLGIKNPNYPIDPMVGVEFELYDGNKIKILLNQDYPGKAINGKLDGQYFSGRSTLIKDLYKWTAKTGIKTACDELIGQK